MAQRMLYGSIETQCSDGVNGLAKPGSVPENNEHPATSKSIQYMSDVKPPGSRGYAGTGID